jgi:hypothetical protein
MGTIIGIQLAGTSILRTAEYRAEHPELNHYECASQAEFDAFRIGASSLILFKSVADQYAARYELDDEFREKEVGRTAVRRKSRPDWTLSWTLRRVFKTIHNRGSIGALQEQTLTERLGYSLSALRQHLEALMTDSMTWQLYLDAYVVIDHIKPICRFDMQDRAQFLECWALPTLQPPSPRPHHPTSRSASRPRCTRRCRGSKRPPPTS